MTKVQDGLDSNRDVPMREENQHTSTLPYSSIPGSDTNAQVPRIIVNTPPPQDSQAATAVSVLFQLLDLSTPNPPLIPSNTSTPPQHWQESILRDYPHVFADLSDSDRAARMSKIHEIQMTRGIEVIRQLFDGLRAIENSAARSNGTILTQSELEPPFFFAERDSNAINDQNPRHHTSYGLVPTSQSEPALVEEQNRVNRNLEIINRNLRVMMEAARRS